jgi:hypothetical protein
MLNPTTPVWIVYTMMLGYPLPTIDSPEFSNRTACEIYLRSYSEEVVDTFKLVCSQK